MILAIDIGNTTVALGGIKDGRVCFVAHMDTVRTRTAAEYRIEMEKVFAHRRHPEKPIRFEGAVLTSVVPQITGALAECARYYTGKKPVIVSPEIRTGLTMGVPDPHAVGKDRLVDAAYAAANFPLPVITVDLGTATTFNVVDENRVFRGGVICPGLSTGLRALGERCAQLPQVRLSSPKAAIGVNTESCMLSGSVLGTAVLLDGITQRIEEELGRPATLVVTGGLAKYVTPLCRHVEKPMACTAAQTEELAALARRKKVFLFEAMTTQYLENYNKIRELLPRIGRVKLVQCNFSQYSSRYDAFCAGETPVSFDPECAGGALMDLNVYNISYIVGLFGEPNQVHYLPNMERGIDTSGILTMEYNSFKAVSMAAKDCGAPARYAIQGTKGYILQKSTANWCGGVTFHPNQGKEEHFNLNGGRPRQAAEFHAFARAIEGGDQELCSRMLDTSVAVSRVLETARRDAGIRFTTDL